MWAMVCCNMEKLHRLRIMSTKNPRRWSSGDCLKRKGVQDHLFRNKRRMCSFLKTKPQ